MAVRFAVTRRCRSVAWRAVLFCAMFLVGSYVVFDILDLDGSERVARSNRVAIVASGQESDAERGWRTDLASLDPIQLNPPSLSYAFASSSIGSPSSTT